MSGGWREIIELDNLYGSYIALCCLWYRDVPETTEMPKDAEPEQGKPEHAVSEDVSEKKVPEEDKVKFLFWCNLDLLD